MFNLNKIKLTYKNLPTHKKVRKVILPITVAASLLLAMFSGALGGLYISN